MRSKNRHLLGCNRHNNIDLKSSISEYACLAADAGREGAATLVLHCLYRLGDAAEADMGRFEEEAVRHRNTGGSSGEGLRADLVVYGREKLKGVGDVAVDIPVVEAVDEVLPVARLDVVRAAAAAFDGTGSLGADASQRPYFWTSSSLIRQKGRRLSNFI
jgi:hypothetical protein